MYSAELEQGALKALRRAATAVSPPLKRTLDRLNRTWNELQRDQATPYVAADDIPVAFTEALHQTLATLTDLMVDQPALVADLLQSGADLQRFYFRRAALCAHRRKLRARIRCSTSRCGPAARRCPGDRPHPPCASATSCPAPHLQPRFAAARTVVLFSATLSPQPYHADLLGLPDNTAWIDVPSPFSARQLTVRVARDISTRWTDRDDLAGAHRRADRARSTRRSRATTWPSSAATTTWSRWSGCCASAHPGVPCWEQQRRMPEAAREAFLARFTPGGQGIGFAVLGGAFAEGIDLPGERLIGAFIATLGLPQVNPVNEQIRARMEADLCRRRLRLHLPLPRPAEGGAGRRPRDPHASRRGRAGADGRPLCARRGARAAAGLVGAARGFPWTGNGMNLAISPASIGRRLLLFRESIQRFGPT